MYRGELRASWEAGARDAMASERGTEGGAPGGRGELRPAYSAPGRIFMSSWP